MSKKTNPAKMDGAKRKSRQVAATAEPTPAAASLAGFDFMGYNRQFMARDGESAVNDAAAYGPRIETILVEPGQAYWKVIGIHHLTPDENRDRHHAFIEALDEAGQRVKNGDLRLGWTWEGKSDGPAEPKRLDKPDDEPAADVPLAKEMTVALWLEGAGPSEQIAGIHTRHEDEVGPGGGRSSRFHHSYYIVFQRTKRAEHGDEEKKGEEGENIITTGPFRFLCWPTDRVRITQPFGANPAFYATYDLPGHEGVDIAAREDDPVYCVAPGVVKMVNTPAAYAQNGHAYGAHVRITHAEGYETIYAHLKELRVQVGQTVAAGQVLGLADHTGNIVGDPPDHLHLTLKRAGEAATGYPNNIIDPTPFLRPLQEPFKDDGYMVTSRLAAAKLGLNCNAPVDAHGAITPRLAEPHLIAETGVEWVRLNFIVRPFAGPDDPQWIATYRRIIDGLRGEGLQIYGLIGAEAVAQDPGNDFRDPPPPEPADHAWIRAYARNFRKIVELFGRDVPIIESFNEPNDWHRTPGDLKKWEQAWVDPGWFAIMLQRVYEAVRDLDVTLVSGPLLSTQHGNDAAVYLPKVYEAGRARFGWGKPGMPVPFDGVGFHPYVLGDSYDPEVEIPPRYHQYIAEVREAIQRHDAPDKPLFLSEMGWQNAEERQAACMETSLTCALDDPAVALCFWYGMQDDAGESYGLYRKEGLSPGHRKPVHARFVDLATAARVVPVAPIPAKPSAARFVRELDSVADGTVLGAGSGFTKVWQLQNTGATTWGDGYEFVLADGESLGAPHRLAVPHCRPGQCINLAISFVAPSNPGQYVSTWSLADPKGRPFGEQVWTRIQVTAPHAVPLPAPVAAPRDLAMEAASALPGLAELNISSPVMATALGIIYQSYWLRVWAAQNAPDPQQAILAAADDALAQIRALVQGDRQKD